jgi:hypothetical protein
MRDRMTNGDYAAMVARDQRADARAAAAVKDDAVRALLDELAWVTR